MTDLADSTYPEHNVKTVAIIDFDTAGHHLDYLRSFSSVFLELNYEVTAFYPEPEFLNSWIAINQKNQSANFQSTKIGRLFGNFGSRSQRFKVLINWLSVAYAINKQYRGQRHKPDFVFFAFIDEFRFTKDHPLINKAFLWISRFIFPYKFSGLYFHPDHLRNLQYQRNLHITTPTANFNIDQIFMSQRCKSVAVLDEGVVSALEKEIEKRVITFPDFTDTHVSNKASDLLNEIKEKAHGKTIIGLCGVLSKWKGLMTLLQVAKQSAGKQWFFLFVGEMNWQSFTCEEQDLLRSTLKDPPINCFFHFEKIQNTGEFNAILNLCDIIFACYHQFPHSSNMLTKAAAFKIPIIVSTGYCMEERVTQYNLGISIKEENVGEVEKAIETIISEENNGSPSQREYKKYETLHSKDQLSNLIQELLKIT